MHLPSLGHSGSGLEAWKVLLYETQGCADWRTRADEEVIKIKPQKQDLWGHGILNAAVSSRELRALLFKVNWIFIEFL